MPDARAGDGGSEVLAALRDASWHARPNTHSPKRYHVVIDTEKWIAACSTPHHMNDARIVLADFTARPASEIHEQGRCQRNGCKQRWPK